MTTDSGSGSDPLLPLAEEFAERYRQGERPSLTEYTERYPELAGRIRELFPALVVMEQFGSAPQAPRPSVSRAGAERTLPPQLGDYRVVREIARGGMGVVYEAVQVSLGRHVALKVLPAHGLLPPTYLERFRREAKAAARLHHTNIVPVYGVGESDGVHYYAMQFIQGQGLDAVLGEVKRLRDQGPAPGQEGANARAALAVSVAQGLLTGEFPGPDVAATAPGAGDNAPRPPAEAARPRPDSTSTILSQPHAQYFRSVAEVGVQVAEALAYAHQQGVLHRDIKPSNLLLDARGTVWVTDFGLAKEEGADELTTPGDIVGTIRYMAPERFSGHSDPRSDVYGLGLTLYEMLTLRPAHADTDRGRLIRRITEEDPPRPRLLDPRIPRDLETIVLKAIAREPEQRYRSAAAVAEDLGRFLADRPILARRTSAWEQARRWCRRNPAVASLAAAVALVLLAGVIASSHFAFQATRRAREAEDNAETANSQRGIAVEKEKTAKANELLARRRFYAAQINLAQQAWEAGDLARALSILETQRPRFDEEDLRTFEWYCLWKLCHQRLRFSWRLKSGNTYAVACSPDGTLLACGGSDGKVTLFDTATGKERGTLQEKAYGSNAVAFSPDGQLLAQAAGPTEDEVTLWDVSTGRRRSVLKGTGKARCLAFAPNGVTLGTGNQDGVLQLWDVVTGKLRASLQERPGRVHCLAFCPDSKIVAASWDDVIRLWDVTTAPPKGINTIPLVADTLAFSPDGKVLASAKNNEPIILWDWSSGKRLDKRPETPWGSGFALAFAPDGKTLAVGVEARAVKLFDLETGKDRTLPHHEVVKSLALSRDGKLLASVSDDARVKLWDLSRAPEPDVLNSPDEIVCAAISADSKRLAFGGTGKAVKVYDLTTLQLTATFTDHDDTVRGVAFSPDGRLLASCNSLGEGKFPGVRLWDLDTGKELVDFPRHPGGTFVVAFSPDGQTLAFGTPPGPGHLWDLGTRQARATWKDTNVYSLAFSPDSQALAVAGWGVVELRSAATGQLRMAFRPPGAFRNAPIGSVAYSPDGKLLAAGDPDGSIWVWDFPTGRLRASLRGHTSRIRSLAFFPDSNTLASACAGNVVRLWDVGTGQERLTFNKTGSLAAVTPDGKTLAIGTWGHVRLLRAATDPEALAYRTELDPADPESPVAVSNTGDLLCSAGRFEEAKDAYDRARLRLEKLAARFPDDPDYRRELVRNGFNVYLLLTADSQSPERDQARAHAMKLFHELPPDDQQALARQYGDLGESLRKAGRKQESESAFTLAIELKPDDPSVWFRRAYAYGDSGQHEKALADYSKVIELSPKWAGAWNNRGVCYGNLGRLAQAIENYSRALELKPSDVLPWHNRGRTYARQRRWDKALADFSKAVELKPAEAQYWYDRAGAHFNLGQYDKAIVDYSKAIGLKPDFADAWNHRGAAHGRLGRYDKALADYSRAIKLKPEYVLPRQNRASIYAQLGQWDKALADFSKVIELKADHVEAWFGRAGAHAGLEKWDQALADYSRVIELKPAADGAWFRRGLVFAARGQWGPAHRDLAKAIELAPQNWQYRRARGSLLATRKEWDKAAADFAKAVELGGKDPDALLSVGNAYQEFGRLEQAERHYSRAIALKPQEPETWYHRGALRLGLGRWEGAVADLNKVIELATGENTAANVFRLRATALAQLGRFPEALADYQKSLKQAPKDPVAHNDLAWFLATCPDAKLRHPKRAVRLARKAVELAPKDGNSWNTLGVAHYRAGNWEEAITALRRSTELREGGDAFDWFFLAMAHWKLGQKGDARKCYEQAIRWMKRNKEGLEKDLMHAAELRRFRAEAAALLGR